MKVKLILLLLIIFSVFNCNDDICPENSNCDDSIDQSFTSKQPYSTLSDLRGLLSVRMIEDGLLSAGNRYTYMYGVFDDLDLRQDIISDLEAGNYNGPLDSLLELLGDDYFKNATCGNDPRVARILLGSFTDNTFSNQFKWYIIENSFVRFQGDSSIVEILGFEPSYENNFVAKNFRQFGLIILADKADGVSGQTFGPILNNEAVDLLDTNGSSDVEQLNLDAVTMFEIIMNWNNEVVRNDRSKYGLEVNDDIARVSLSGVISTPEREEFLIGPSPGESLYLLADGAKIARGIGFVPSDNNYISEGLNANYPLVTVDLPQLSRQL